MQLDGRLGSRMLEILLPGVSTRQYKHALPVMTSKVRMGKSSVSAKAIATSEKESHRPCERRWHEAQLLIVYLDGLSLASQHVLAAMGVDAVPSKLPGAPDGKVV